MEFVKTRSTLSEAFECNKDGYKVTVNATVEGAEVKSLNGCVAKATEGEYVDGVYYNAYKRADGWHTDVGEVSNTEYAKVTELAIGAVNYAVGQYEA